MQGSANSPTKLTANNVVFLESYGHGELLTFQHTSGEAELRAYGRAERPHGEDADRGDDPNK